MTASTYEMSVISLLPHCNFLGLRNTFRVCDTGEALFYHLPSQLTLTSLSSSFSTYPHATIIFLLNLPSPSLPFDQCTIGSEIFNL
jgi:hypothetical protein